MLHKKRLVFLCWLLTFSTYAQIQITFPVSRIVFQRNNNNQASVNITGSYLQHFDRIEARAVPVATGQGTELGWTTIQSILTNGLFNGFLDLKGGWYNIEVRGILNNKVVTSATLERVGVGEVFVVAGQSNAQGDNRFAGAEIGASDDRVSTIDYYEPVLDESKLPFKFSHMDNSTKMAPYNYVPWFWGRLGDKLAQRLNVPVLFYGAALGGIGAHIWERSAKGEDLTKELPMFIAVPGMPYRALKATLQHYATRTGLRGVLWQQGESDTETRTEDYFSYLKTIIETSRKDSGKENLAWMIARSSRNPIAQPNVINGQNLAIIQIPGVFPGPLTDEIEGPAYRDDGIHFHKEGLVMAADYWNRALEDWILNASKPLEAKRMINVKISCNLVGATNSFTLSVEGDYKDFAWSNGANSRSITVNSGSYTVQTHDANGNTFFSQPITISANNAVSKPTITINGPDFFCETDSIQLISSIATGNVWSNGKSGQNMVIRAPGEYFVTSYSINGCMAVSDPVTIAAKKGPPKPVINASGAITFCEGQSVSLTAPQSLEYSWSNKTKGRSITINTSGTFFVQVKDTTGCFSQPSDEIEVIVKENPPTGIIYQTGPYSLGTPYVGRTGSTFEWLKDGIKLPDNQSSIKVTQAGAYSVKEISNYTFDGKAPLSCFSKVSEPFHFIFEVSDGYAKIFPNPIADNLVNIEAMNSLQAVWVYFYDLKGAIVRDFYVGDLNTRQTLSLSGLSKGPYIVVIKNNDFSISKRVVLQ